MNQFVSQASHEDFFRARNKALINDLQHFLNPEETKLLSFNDIKQMLKPRNEIYLGMKVVPIELIVGSEGRYQDFDNRFFPRSAHLKTRWARIAQAHLSDVILPPITLYEIGGLYFVRDGNHRVSVARSKGVENIDAEVISLQSEIKLRPSTSKKGILKQIIQYEKRVFYAETNFGDITDCWNIDFSTPGQYDVLYQHILIHKYYINQNKSEEISMQEAIISWYEKVYVPVIQAIKKQKLLKKFKHRTLSDMYVWLIRYWDEIKMKFGQDIGIDSAASEFNKKFSPNIVRRIIDSIKFILKP
jgi:hypothetical protein